jgi:hypothetical protein
METDVSTQQCKRRRYYGNGDVIDKERFGVDQEQLSSGIGRDRTQPLC